MKIDELSLVDLRNLGVSYGLDMPATASKAQLIKLITSSTSVDPDNVVLAEGVAAVEVAKPVAPKSPDRIKVIFHNQEGDGGSAPITVTHNTKRYDIPREVEVDLPIEVLGVIDDAVITESYYDAEGQIKDRNRKRFPYTRV